MKKCRRCSKPATLHITEIREGKATAIHLCETCARDYLESPEQDAPSDPATELAAKLDELVREGSEEIMAALVCPVCGISFSEFRESGRFGCPADYTEFSTEILPLFDAGIVKPVIDSRYSLAAIADAHAYMETNANVGKILIDV